MTLYFKPASGTGATKTLAVTTTNQSVALSTSSQSIVGHAVLLTNVGSNPCYVGFSGVSIFGVAGNSLPVLPAQPVIVPRDILLDLYLGAVSDVGQTTTLKVTEGRIVR